MLDRQLRTLIADYLAGRLELNDLEERVVADAWGAEAQGEFVAAAIADRLMFALAELDASHISEADVRERLAPLAPEWAVPITPSTGSSSLPTRAERWLAGAAVVGRPREVASV